MNRKHLSYVALVSFGLVTGCSRQIELSYQPIVRGVEDPNTTLSLTVVDARAPGEGGDDKTEVGRVRGGYGSPFPVYETSPQRVAQIVRDATADALSHARVKVQEGGPRRLRATVKNFWIDGYMGYKANIAVQCDLQDDNGKVLWTAMITGGGGGMPWWSIDTFIVSTFQQALADYSEHAIVDFNSAAFQKQLY